LVHFRVNFANSLALSLECRSEASAADRAPNLIASPTIFSAITEMPEVKSILPSKIDDIYPKPKGDD